MAVAEAAPAAAATGWCTGETFVPGVVVPDDDGSGPVVLDEAELQLDVPSPRPRGCVADLRDCCQRARRSANFSRIQGIILHRHWVAVPLPRDGTPTINTGNLALLLLLLRFLAGDLGQAPSRRNYLITILHTLTHTTVVFNHAKDSCVRYGVMSCCGRSCEVGSGTALN